MIDSWKTFNMDNKHRLEVEQTDKAKANVEEKERLVTIEKVEDKEKAKEILKAWLKTEEGKNALLDGIERSLEVEVSIKVKDDKKVELEGKITAENVKLAAEKKAEKTGIEGGAMSKSKDEGKDKPEGPKNEKVKYKYIELFSVKDQPLKETTLRDRCASNQLAEAKVEREDKLKAEEKQT